MSSYGFPSTIFDDLSNDELLSFYRSEQWSRLGQTGRRELLQETVNRAARSMGQQGACRVTFEDLGPHTYGEQTGDEIRLNRSIFVDETPVPRVYNGHVFYEPRQCVNLQALETVLHENIHAWQNQCIDGTIPLSDPELLAQYQANDFDRTMVQTDDGKIRIGQQYLTGASKEGGYYFYYLQSSERDAHRFSQQWTVEVMEKLEQQFGTEPSFEAYRNDVAANGYEATLNSAKVYFGCETIEQDINTTLKNQYFGTDEPVNSKDIEQRVKQEMIESYQNSIRHSQTQQSGLQETGGGQEPPAVTKQTPALTADEGIEDDSGIE